VINVNIDLIGVPTFVVAVEADGTFRFQAMNQAEENATGLRAADVVGRRVDDCLPGAVARHVVARFRECIEARALQEYDEWLELSGSTRWWRTTLSPRVDAESGRVVEIVGVSVEITERKRTEDELAEVAFQDPLTGIANRRRFELDVEDAMADVDHSRRRFGLALIDLEHFKPINDTYGHQKGDDVLRHIASLLKLTTRENEIVARIGGDEFAMLIRASTETELAGKIDALRRFLDRSMNISDIEVNVGASIGAALWTGEQTREELLAVADEAMYRQKAKRQAEAA
jgi:diguanylate cyclase (GGDEF)-like protein/PAS domain S-box-containing protein